MPPATIAIIDGATDALRALAEFEAALREAVERDPDHWNHFHTARLAAARGKATRLLEKHHVEIPDADRPADNHRA